MKINNNYSECLTNLACSIRKYFELDYKHNTLEYIDKILEEKQPKNVVTILFDGMGSKILDKILPPNSFLLSHRFKEISTVFPATTVAATTSITTGLNPVETGMLGWNMYFKEIDKTIATFKGCEKGSKDKSPLEEAEAFKKKYMKTKTIMEDINEKGKYKGYKLFPFGEEPYGDLDEMLNKIEKLCSEDGKKYIYAYDTEPDHLMHRFGTYCSEVKDLIRYRNFMIEKLCDKLEDTIIFIVADHGHIPVENIHLENYPEIVECLRQNTSIEPRAVNFFIKKDKKEKFVQLFNESFGNYFNLYSKQEVIDSQLFGDGEENPIFDSALGDFLAIAKENKTILFNGDTEFLSQHAGITDDEILVPLIVVQKGPDLFGT